MSTQSEADPAKVPTDTHEFMSIDRLRKGLPSLIAVSFHRRFLGGLLPRRARFRFVGSLPLPVHMKLAQSGAGQPVPNFCVSPFEMLRDHVRRAARCFFPESPAGLLAMFRPSVLPKPKLLTRVGDLLHRSPSSRLRKPKASSFCL